MARLTSVLSLALQASLALSGLGSSIADAQEAAPQATSKTADEKTPEAAPHPTGPVTRAEEHEDERAIRKIVEQSEAAFNEGDADKLAGFFAEQGEVIDSSGQILRGRDILAQRFREMFEHLPGGTMKLQIDSIRILAPNIAIEEGVSTWSGPEHDRKDTSRYLVIYIRENDEWRMLSARDLPEASPTNDELQQLNWLMGTWIDENEDCKVKTTYEWSENRKSIVGSFEVRTHDDQTMTGTMSLSWDPQKRMICSTVTDSEGGTARGVWSRRNNQWLIKFEGVLADGRSTSVTHHLQQVSEDHVVLVSRDRVVAGTILDDSEPIVLVRRGPDPETVSQTGSDESDR